MKKLTKLFMITFLVSLVIPSIVTAQQGTMAQHRFEQEFQATNEVIRRAGEAINQSGLERGREMLNIAVKLQEQAQNYGRNHQYVMGGKLTMEAREKAKAAMALSMQAIENANLVQRQLEKNDGLIARVQARIGFGDNDMVESLFNAARENQRRAWELFHSGQLRPALKLAHQAEASILRVAEMVKSEAGQLNRIQNQIRQTKAQMEQIRNMLQNCQSEEADRLMAEAGQSFQECHQYANNGQLKQAENKIRATRRLLRSAADICEGNGSQWRILNRISDEIDRVGRMIRNSGDEKALKFYDTAVKHMEKAQNHCAEGEAKACAANIKAAQMNLEKAKRMIGL
jgi:hypothetical protein